MAAAVADAAKRLERAGWAVEEIKNSPPLREAAELQTKLWLGDGYQAQLEAAEREGDPGALACLRGNRDKVQPFDAASFSKALTRRATLVREWQSLFEDYAVLLMPVSGELPFPDGLDRRDEASFARVWRAQLTQIGQVLTWTDRARPQGRPARTNHTKDHQRGDERPGDQRPARHRRRRRGFDQRSECKQKDEWREDY